MFNFLKKAPETENEIGDILTGEKDPTTGVKIIYISYQTGKFIVSIDNDINLNWSTTEEITYATDFGEITNQVSLSESLVDRIFREKKDRIAYKKMLGDVLGTLLDEAQSSSAQKMLEEVNARINEHSREKVRMAYISYAVGSVAVVGLLVIISVIFRIKLHELFQPPEVFKICICTLLGGVGAFISAFTRFQNYNGRIIAGLHIHRLDGFLRVFYGLIAGLLISLAIKGKVIAGVLV